MRRFLKYGALVALVFALVWLAVIIWWQETRTLPSGLDIALYLFALPAALLLALFLGVKAVRAASAPKPAPEAAPDAAPQAPRHARLVVLAAAASAGPGTSAQAILDACAAQARAALDPELVSRAGYPVFAARHAALNTATLRLHAAIGAASPAEIPDAALRACALAEPVAQALVEQADEHVVATQGRLPASQRPTLHMDVALPPGWSAAAQRLALETLARAAAIWPPEQLHLALIPPAQAHPDADGDTTQPLLRALGAHDIPGMRIVLALDSAIDAGVIGTWEDRGALMGPDTPAGRVPGESAAGLLLATGGAPAAGASTLVFSPQVQRGRAADARGAASDTTLGELADAFLPEEKIDTAQVAAVVSDADHRGSRTLESVGLTARLFPQLDPAKDCLVLGTACGATGAASTLLTLALALEASRAAQAPALALLTQDPLARALAVVLPPSSSAA